MTNKVEATNGDAPSTPWVHPNERVLDPTKIEQSLLDRMPEPTGWRLACFAVQGQG